MRDVRNKRVGVSVDPTTHIGRGIIEGIVQVARPYAWRLTQELADVDGCIGDATSDIPDDFPAIRVLRADAARPSVTIDEAAVAAVAMEHFRARGYRHFLYLADDDADAARGDAFAKDFERTASRNEAAHLVFFREDAAQTFSDSELGDWLRTLRQPLACFCSDDGLAARAIRGIANSSWPGRPARGASIKDVGKAPLPQNSPPIAVLGVGNDGLVCEFAEVPVSSIDLNARQIGIRAADALAKRMAGRAAKTTMVPPLGVIERASTDMLAIDDDDIVRTLQFIRQNAGSGIRMNDILRVSDLPRRTLERRFAAVFGESPPQVLRRERIKLAKQLLATSDASIGLIATQCGYKIAQQFGVAFRQIVGISPSEYRRQFRA